MKPHWSFAVCDKKYLYPVAALLILIGVTAALALKEPTQFNRVGNFIVGVGVWMSLRSTLREGIKRDKDLADRSPTLPGTNQINAEFFNQIAFSIGDAQLQVHGFALVIVGSIVGSYGDVILHAILPHAF